MVKAVHDMSTEQWRKTSNSTTIYVLNELSREPQVQAVRDMAGQNWSALPTETRKKLFMDSQDELNFLFIRSIQHDMQTVREGLLSRRACDELVDACKHALGTDIVVELVGSLTRNTAFDEDSDLDMQVRRTGERADEEFMEEDKLKVAQNLQTLPFVGKVAIGNVAVKFDLGNLESGTLTHVDLVLFRKRPEQFPRLRGGDDFCANSARINEFLEQTPAAAAAVIGIKNFFRGERPSGILLEAIVWRLSSRFPLSSNVSVFASSGSFDAGIREECFQFFTHVVKKTAALAEFDIRS